MNNLLNAMGNVTATENGAVTLRDTGSAVLDLFYHGAAKRNQDITDLIREAYFENPMLTIVTMFYIRNIRGTGQGERSAFNQFLVWLDKNDPLTFEKIVHLVPQYGYWKDVTPFYYSDAVRTLVYNQLKEDFKNPNPSLLAKWMPSINTSSKATRELAWNWITAFKTDRIKYQNTLSRVRAKIRLVEQKMSANEWDEIEYTRVPSKAMKNYRKAFGKHDAERFGKFLEAANNGEVKINSGTLYPYELVAEYVKQFESMYNHRTISVDQTIEAQWKQLSNFVEGENSMLVMADVSGSMFQQNNIPINSSVGIAIYLAERNKGIWANKFITFTDVPTIIELHKGTLADKVKQVFKHVGYNTDFQAGMDAILTAAKRNKLAQADLPTHMIVISDMEFDHCGSGTNFEVTREKFRQAGYSMPTMVFWNVASRNKQTPVNMREDGVVLVSGQSPSIFKNIMSGENTNPYDMMIEVLHDEVFTPVWNVLENPSKS